MNTKPDSYEVLERAAIRQFDGGQDAAEALVIARKEVAERPKYE